MSRGGAWLEWIHFFLRGVKSARNSVLLQALLQQLFENPATTIPQVAARFGITYVAAKKNIDKLVA